MTAHILSVRAIKAHRPLRERRPAACRLPLLRVARLTPRPTRISRCTSPRRAPSASTPHATSARTRVRLIGRPTSPPASHPGKNVFGLYPWGGVPHCHVVWYDGPSHLTARRLPVMTRSSGWVGGATISGTTRQRPVRLRSSTHAQCIACDRVRARMDQASTCHDLSRHIDGLPRVTVYHDMDQAYTCHDLSRQYRRLAWLLRYLGHVGIGRVQFRVKE